MRRQLRKAFLKIHLVDKCLLLFMVILLLQSAYSLIASGGAFSDSSHIDIIIRTSAAAIFGYFLSANFIRHAASPEHKTGEVPRHTSIDYAAKPQGVPTQNRIGFAQSGDPQTLETGADENTGLDDDSDTYYAGCLQIITAAGIGIFCLIVLILVRNFAGWDENVSPSITATVAQLRDFVSGSVGFLLGSPTSGIDKNR